MSRRMPRPAIVLLASGILSLLANTLDAPRAFADPVRFMLSDSSWDDQPTIGLTSYYQEQPGAAPEPNTTSQPPARSSTRSTGPTPTTSFRRRRTRRFARLDSVPNMNGDFFGLGGTFSAITISTTFEGTGDIPLAGGSRRYKAAENNKALPMDRVFFMYNHFRNGLSARSMSFHTIRESRFADVDRYTLGAEKTFFEQTWSIEARMPLVSKFEFQSIPYDVAGGRVGNLALALKALLYADECNSCVVGLGVDLPTGDDAFAEFRGNLFTRLRIRNEAVHLSPYLGAMHTSCDQKTFFHGFAQLDFATGGNPIEDRDFDFQYGVLDEQTLLFLDASAGRWLLRRDNCGDTAGIAALLELHYTTTLQDGDAVAFAPFGVDFLSFHNPANRVDVLNLTAGLHFQPSSAFNFRVAGSFPLKDDDNRLFSSEILVSVNRNF